MQTKEYDKDFVSITLLCCDYVQMKEGKDFVSIKGDHFAML